MESDARSKTSNSFIEGDDIMVLRYEYDEVLEILQKHPEAYRKILDDGDIYDDEKLYEELYEYFLSDMPYGTQKARDGDLPECTDEERWLRGEMYAVRKEGRITAVRVFDQEEEARIGQLLPEEQVEYYKQKAQQVSSVAQPDQTAQQSQLDPREEAQLQLLADEVQSRISQTGMNIRLDDSRLWTGPNPENNWSQNMSVSEAVKVVERNLNRLQPQNTVSQTNTTPPAPTTQGAPQKTAKTIRTLSEAATFFADGNINSTQYRDIKNQLKQGGSATL